MAGKADIVECVADATDLTKKQVVETLDAFVECVTNTLAAGDKVQMPGFGTFVTSERAARTGRNPQTGKPLKIAASTGVRFKAGKALKDAVNG